MASNFQQPKQKKPRTDVLVETNTEMRAIPIVQCPASIVPVDGEREEDNAKNLNKLFGLNF